MYVTRENVPFINNNIDLSKISDESYCKVGDLIIADASEDYKDVGKSIEIRHLDNQKLVAGTHTYLARDNKYVTSLGFMGYMMQVENIRVKMMTMETGISVLGISKGNLSKVNISLPSKHEQTKIAGFLTFIDKKITLVSKQLEKTKNWKKGLLQQMFI